MNGSDISDGERGSSPVEPRDDATSKKLSLRGIGKFVADLAANGISSSTPDAPSEDALDSDVRESAARSFDLKIQEAEEFADRPESVEDLLDAAKNWTRRFSRKLNSDSLASLTTIFRMTNSSISGEYKGLSKQTLACMIGALLYCVSPIDVVPDAIPVVGLLDDAFVL